MATPIEQQMSGVSGMNYMYSLSASSGGGMTLYVDFQLGTDINTDQILAQMRQGQANSQLPAEVTQQGVIVQPGTTAPFMLLDLYSPGGTYDNIFLANYATINLQYALTRLPGVGQVQIFGAGPYAMRIWVNPDKLANLGVTVTDITNAVKAQNKVNPAGQIGGEPVPQGQQFTYNVRAPGRLPTAADFDEIVVRAQADGSILRLKDVARVEMGSQYYSYNARLGKAPEEGKPADAHRTGGADRDLQHPRKQCSPVARSHPQDDGRGQGTVSRRDWTTTSLWTPHWPSVKASTRFTRPWERP